MDGGFTDTTRRPPPLDRQSHRLDLDKAEVARLRQELSLATAAATTAQQELQEVQQQAAEQHSSVSDLNEQLEKLRKQATVAEEEAASYKTQCMPGVLLLLLLACLMSLNHRPFPLPTVEAVQGQATTAAATAAAAEARATEAERRLAELQANEAKRNRRLRAVQASFDKQRTAAEAQIRQLRAKLAGEDVDIDTNEEQAASQLGTNT